MPGKMEGKNMPSPAGADAAGHAWFVVNRARVEGPALFDDACRDYYQLRLLNSLRVFRVRLHAYALLPTEAWLLLSPEMPKSLFSMLDYVNGCYSEYFNERFGRNSAVFAQQPSLAAIDSAPLLLDCQKMIERWPLAHGGVCHPGRYPWSSYAFNAFGGGSRFLSRHRFFSRLHRFHRPCLAALPGVHLHAFRASASGQTRTAPVAAWPLSPKSRARVN